MDMLACLDMRKLLSTLTTTFSSRNITEQFLSYVPPPLSSILSYKAARRSGCELLPRRRRRRPLGTAKRQEGRTTFNVSAFVTF